MTVLPQIGLSRLAAGDPAAVRALLDACRTVGTILLSDVPPHVLAEPVTLAQQFFALDEAVKRRLDIAYSPHFRGFSVMHNERDWREQLHFGRERPARRQGPPWARLDGPNQWPATAGLRTATLDVMRQAEAIGRTLLAALSHALDLRPGVFAAPADDAYTLMKFIRYHAQPEGDALRRGVAAHCDFSWLTLLFQDDVGGLQVMDRAGCWIDVPAASGLVVVNVGELLQFATSGDLFAAPHRVINPSRAQHRLSVPVFINPPLDGEILRVGAAVAVSPWPEIEHVHRVLTRAQIVDPAVRCLHFGHAEWRRKGENIWCAACCAA